MSSMRIVAVLLVAGFGTAASPLVRQDPSDPAIAAAGRIRPSWISAHVRFLAGDLLQGRETATRGAQLAATYVAAQFESYGLQAAGTGGSFLQRMPLRRSEVVEGASSVVLIAGDQRQELVFGKDFLLHPAMSRDRVDVTAPVVFVGFGVTVPEQGYDDYAGIDARGKVVAMLFGGPTTLPSDERGHYSLLHTKEENALAHGAVGMVSILPAPGELIREKAVRQLDGFGWLDSAGTPHSLFFEQGPVVRMSASGGGALLSRAGRSLSEVIEGLQRGTPQSFELPVQLSLRAEFRHADTASANVVGLLRGSDPRLRDEYVVYTAHLDHVGIGPSVDGDSVYHGALDNAGGTAVLMAIARAYATLPRPPRRSVLFVAVTGEEKGILGSDYFAHHPPVPLDQIVANVNMDNYLMLHPVRDFAAYGADYSTLGDDVRQALTRLELQLSADPAPEQTIFTRSDHYPFMRLGVPGVMLFTGRGSGDGKRDGSQVLRAWLGNVHHTPRDAMGQGIDWGAGVTYARANFLIGYQVANQRRRPQWRGSSFFREQRPASP